jgi:hypothetical protein
MQKVWTRFFLSVLFLFSNAYAAESKKTVSITVEGTYQVYSLEKKDGYALVRFEKHPAIKESKTIILELLSVNKSLLSEGAILDITAEVIDTGKPFLEAEQVLLNFQRGRGGITRVWLLSRKGKFLNFEKSSLLKMHGSENDYQVF